MSISGRELRETLNANAGSESNNLMFYSVLAGIFFIAIVAYVIIGLTGQEKDVRLAENAPQMHAAEIDRSSPLSPEEQMEAAIKNSPQGQIVMAHTKRLAESPRIQNVQVYHATMGKLRSCIHVSNNDARMRRALSSYEKRNKEAAESWSSRDKQMLDRMQKTGKADLETTLWAMNGGMANAALDNMAQFNAFGFDDDGMTYTDCNKIVAQANRKELDIDPRPGS